MEKKYSRVEVKGANHKVFTTEDDPETEECVVEDALLSIFK